MGEDEVLNKKYEQLKMYEEHVRKLNQELGRIQERSSEIEHTVAALEEFKGHSSGKKSLFPIADGIFIRGEVKDDKKVFVNVGKGTIVEKSIDEAKEMLSSQLGELEDYNERIIAEMAEIDEKAYAIQEDVLKRGKS